jgi:hypothetical protein
MDPQLESTSGGLTFSALARSCHADRSPSIDDIATYPAAIDSCSETDLGQETNNNSLLFFTCEMRMSIGRKAGCCGGEILGNYSIFQLGSSFPEGQTNPCYCAEMMITTP